MADVPAWASGVVDVINAGSLQAAAWIRGISGTPVVVPGTPSQVAAQSAAISAQTQANLAYTNPTLAGVLNSPTVLIAFVAILIVIVIVALKR